MKRFSVICLAALALAACNSGVKKTLGLERSAPDEFSVVERAPLVVPPNFDLVPPQPGAVGPAETGATQNAQGLVLGSQSSAPKPANGSKAEQSLLRQAGATTVDPNIRSVVNTPVPAKPTAAQKLGITADAKEKETLDPVAEAKKLKEKNVKTVPIQEQKKTDNAK